MMDCTLFWLLFFRETGREAWRKGRNDDGRSTRIRRKRQAPSSVRLSSHKTSSVKLALVLDALGLAF